MFTKSKPPNQKLKSCKINKLPVSLHYDYLHVIYIHGDRGRRNSRDCVTVSPLLVLQNVNNFQGCFFFFLFKTRHTDSHFNREILVPYKKGVIYDSEALPYHYDRTLSETSIPFILIHLYFSLSFLFFMFKEVRF